MSLRNYPILVKITLFFFLCMACYSPVYAQQFDFSVNTSVSSQQISDQNNFPVTYLSTVEAERIFQQYRQRGYQIREGSFQQLAELVDKQQTTATPENNTNTDTNLDDCEKPSETSKNDKQDQAVLTQQAPSQDQQRPSKQEKKPECDNKKQSADSSQAADSPMPVELPAPMDPSQQPLPPPVETPPQPVPETSVHTNVGVYADISYGGGGGGRGDAGKVFFIVAGIMVIAAFIVYAGKYIVDLASGKDMKVWWEFIFSNTYLDTGSGEHGRLNGLKMGTGFVSSDLIQIALIGEIGESNIDLMIDEDTTTVPLDFSATYWLLGASARLHLTDKLVNASYLYLDFMGGKTSHGSTDTIGMARLGASFGVNDYLRLGASIGSFYLGLDEDQGFVNNDDNYWMTLGFEIGAKF